MLENDLEYQCPYCGEMISIRLDATGGSEQEFVTDCEVCCKPIVIRVSFDESGEPDLEAVPEND